MMTYSTTPEITDENGFIYMGHIVGIYTDGKKCVALIVKDKKIVLSIFEEQPIEQCEEIIVEKAMTIIKALTNKKQLYG